MADTNDPIHVIVALDFSDAIMAQLKEVSPRLRIERFFPTVPDKAWAEVEILYTLNIFPDPAQAPRLRWIQVHSAGLNHALKEPIMQAEDVEITTTSGIHAVVMSEFCLGMMLAFNYQIPLMLKLQRAAEWPKDRYKFFSPLALRGKTVGIVGYGAIGRELARAADALGMRVLAIKRDAMRPEDEDGYVESGTGDPQGDMPERIYPPEAIQSMARECDYLVVTLPLTVKTTHLINEDVFRAMKKTAVLINVGRGAVVDEDALISALAAERIAGAGLDVFEEEPLPATSPLWNFDNVIISPHVAGYTANYHERAAVVFEENLQRYLEKRPLLNRFRRDQGY
jgi:phosphoglycerate dehydrogenase-like enzyme